MPSAEERAIQAQGAAPLTPLQIRTLAVEARRAFEVQRKLGLAPEDFDTWRHAAIQDAAPGKRGLRDLAQRDFAAVRSWLRELTDGQRPGNERPGEDDDARRARWSLRRTMEARERIFGGKEAAEAYVRSLFERIHKTTPEAATARQIWMVNFTLRNRNPGGGRPNGMATLFVPR